MNEFEQKMKAELDALRASRDELHRRSKALFVAAEDAIKPANKARDEWLAVYSPYKEVCQKIELIEKMIEKMLQ